VSEDESMQFADREFRFGEQISTKYFKCKIDKLSNFNYPIMVIFNIDNRYIYDAVIKQNLSVQQLDNDIPIIKIVYRDTIKERAIRYIESLSQTLILENINNKREENRKVVDFVNSELERIKERLTESEKRLESYRVSNKVIKPSVQAGVMIKELSKIELQLSENLIRKNLVSNLAKVVEGGKYSIGGIAPFLMELNDRATLKLVEDLEKYEIEYSQLMEEFTDRHPKVQALTKKISIIKRKIRINIKNLKSRIYQESRKLQEIKDKYSRKLESLPIKERKLVNMQRDYEVSSSMYNFLLKRKAENDMVRASTLSDYKIIDKAYASNAPISPNRLKTMLSYIIAGALLALIYIAIKEKDKIKSVDDIESELNMPIYGVLSAKRHLSDIYLNWNREHLESYINLRTNIRLKLDKRGAGGKVILIGASSNEHKDRVLINSATIFHKAMSRVVVVDLDFRDPKLYKMLRMEGVYRDIVDYLNGDCKIEDILYSTRYEGLDFIPIKQIADNPSELVLYDRLSKLFNILRGSYDYIMINSTPFDIIKDFRYIIKYSDINLFVVEKFMTRKSSIVELKSIVEEDKINNIGFIYIDDV